MKTEGSKETMTFAPPPPKKKDDFNFRLFSDGSKQGTSFRFTVVETGEMRVPWRGFPFQSRPVHEGNERRLRKIWRQIPRRGFLRRSRESSRRVADRVEIDAAEKF